MDAGNTSRMALRASRPTDGAWAFTITDHSGAAQLLLDDRYRNDICRRVGQDLRCEIRGLFPGGHSVEVQMPNAVLRRTALIGIPWPKHPLVVRVYDVEQARSAAYAGADAVLYEGEDRDVAQDITRVAHAGGARMIVALPGEAVAFTGADAVWDPSNLSADGAVIYETGSGKVVVVLDFGQTVTSMGGPFRVSLPATGPHVVWLG